MTDPDTLSLFEASTVDALSDQTAQMARASSDVPSADHAQLATSESADRLAATLLDLADQIEVSEHQLKQLIEDAIACGNLVLAQRALDLWKSLPAADVIKQLAEGPPRQSA